jgi:hypothetical protein
LKREYIAGAREKNNRVPVEKAGPSVQNSAMCKQSAWMFLPLPQDLGQLHTNSLVQMLLEKDCCHAESIQNANVRIIGGAPPIAHTCNPSYSGGRDQETLS